MIDATKGYRERDIAVAALGAVFGLALVVSYLGLLPSTRWANTLVVTSLIGVVFLLGFEIGIRLWSHSRHRHVGRVAKRIIASWSWLLVASTLVWLGSLAAPYSWRVIASWQLPLVGGIVFGFYNPQVTQWWYGMSHRVRVWLLGLSSAGSIIGFTLCSTQVWLYASQSLVTLAPSLLLLAAGWVVGGYHGLKYLEGRLGKLLA